MAKSDHAKVIAPPPLVYAGAFILVLVLERFLPLPIWRHPVTPWIGAGLLVLGIAWNLSGALAMKRAATPINPYRPVSGIVATGGFRFSRNPLYMGINLVFAGLSLILNTLWGLVLLVPVLIVMHYGVIRREERYLEAKFGDSYQSYRAKVRRYF